MGKEKGAVTTLYCLLLDRLRLDSSKPSLVTHGARLDFVWHDQPAKVAWLVARPTNRLWIPNQDALVSFGIICRMFHNGKEKGVLSPPLYCRRLLSGRSEEAHTLVAVVDHLNVAVKPGLAHLVISHLDQREDLEPRIVGDAHQVGHLDNLLDASVTLVDVIDFFHVILSTLDSPALRKDKRASFQALDIHIRPTL